jgi:hypothetical protein
LSFLSPYYDAAIDEAPLQLRQLSATLHFAMPDAELSPCAMMMPCRHFHADRLSQRCYDTPRIFAFIFAAIDEFSFSPKPAITPLFSRHFRCRRR